MRIRTIKPEFFKDEELAELPAETRLLYIGLWCCADANGVLEYRPKRIQVEVLPYCVSDVSQMFPRLIQGKWVEKYEVEGKHYLYIRNWHKHQRITGKERENGGRFPLPPKDLQKEKQRGNTRDTPGYSPDAQEQGTGNREQGTGNGVKEKQEKESPAPSRNPTRKAIRVTVDDGRQVALGSLFSKTSGNKWRQEDIRRFADADPTPEEVEAVCRFYRAQIRESSDLRFRRKSLETLLNNWTGEVGKAEQFAADPESHTVPQSQRMNKTETNQW